jgi:hypothetical protein
MTGSLSTPSVTSFRTFESRLLAGLDRPLGPKSQQASQLMTR